MSVHVDEVETRVLPAPQAGEDGKGTGQPRLGADADAWAMHLRLARRDACRTAARDFDD
jgi:hypothetical protein